MYRLGLQIKMDFSRIRTVSLNLKKKLDKDIQMCNLYIKTKTEQHHSRKLNYVTSYSESLCCIIYSVIM